ncbi:helix-turn-helix domain-containing protein [Anatilimnocola floriformis]|uniref:helix-turn-helix domain-containing protein n=1 Tax=Anatilimnocola floriformis TaxID=2948575 RepID=UPI0020C1D080|nr:helix-turn-helix transcriptional regulator [Anatilimnocola floriformis]
MRYSFRLAEVVGHVPDPRKRPGTIKAICDYTTLDRHQVAAFLKNEVKYIPLDALSKLCDYLIEKGFATAEELPGRLFAVEPEHFWELLARRRRLELCLGVRRGEPGDTLDDAWVVASDSVLLGELLNGVTSLGGTARFKRLADPNAPAAVPADDPHPEQLHQSLVFSPGQSSFADYVELARSVYDGFCSAAGDKALICLGSNKSNPVVEILLAEAFGATPFESQDSLPVASKRNCPIFIRYRSHDPQTPSCCGGNDLSKSEKANVPGIYYETSDGTWDVCPWEANKKDAAMVFYIHRESQGRLEMMLGGYSGRATRLLARMLSRRGEEFWPPVYSGHGIQIGAFVVKFKLQNQQDSDAKSLLTDLAAESEIIRLAPDVIERRMQVAGDEEM